MRKSEQTKQRIMEKAIEVVSEKGYSSTSTKEIAERAGVSEATIFKYFQTKDDLLEKIVLETIDGLYAYSVNEAIPRTFENSKDKDLIFLVEAMIKERLSFFEANSAAIRVIFQETMINQSIREIFRNKIWTKMRDTFDTILDRGKASGELRDIDNYFLRKIVFGIVFFTIFERALGLESDPMEAPAELSLEDEVNVMLDAVFHGIGSRK